MPVPKLRFRVALHCLRDKGGKFPVWQNEYFQQLFADIPANLYPRNGLWPENEDDLPTNITKSESKSIRNLVEAMDLKMPKGAKEWRPLEVDAVVNEWTPARDTFKTVFEGLLRMAKIHEKLEQVLFEHGFHPGALIRAGLVSFLDGHVHSSNHPINTPLISPRATPMKRTRTGYG
jgi:hypothetical protein